MTAIFLAVDALALKELPEVFDSCLFHVFSDDDALSRHYPISIVAFLAPEQ